MMLDAQGRLFGRINILDAGILLLLIAALLGVLAVQAGWHRTSSAMVTGETDILITVSTLNTRTMQPAMLQPGGVTHVTVRNVPRGELRIQSVTSRPHHTTVVLRPGEVAAVPDVALSNSYDYQLTLQDHAEVTHEGYVANGIKMKIGLPIELEGLTYRIPAVITDVQPVTAAPPKTDPAAH